MQTLRSHAEVALRKVLKQARLEAGLTQRQLAKRMEEPQSYVAKIENGEQAMRMADVPVWAKGCEISAKVLMNRYAEELGRKI